MNESTFERIPSEWYESSFSSCLTKINITCNEKLMRLNAPLGQIPHDSCGSYFWSCLIDFDTAGFRNGWDFNPPSNIDAVYSSVINSSNEFNSSILHFCRITSI